VEQPIWLPQPAVSVHQKYQYTNYSTAFMFEAFGSESHPADGDMTGKWDWRLWAFSVLYCFRPVPNATVGAPQLVINASRRLSESGEYGKGEVHDWMGPGAQQQIFEVTVAAPSTRS
jgi:hypothetical protein